jgi:hypothetical protein
LSLPRLFGTDLGSIPGGVPYLLADPERVARWRQRLAGVPGFRVGINWQGNPRHDRQRRRAVPLEKFAALAAVPGVSLVALQKGAGAEQLAGCPFPVHRLEGLDAAGGAFLDTAAVACCLDLVVTSDTAVAHLAGALGVPTWVALPHAPDWRWLLGRDDTPWYPTMRLFRQETPGDWTGVFARLAEALRGRTASPERPPVEVPSSPAELLDRLAALEVEEARAGCGGRDRGRDELTALRAARERCLAASPELAGLAAELRAAHEAAREAEGRRAELLRRLSEAGAAARP